MDQSILGPVLGSPFLGKLPYRLTLLLAETLQSKSPVAFQVEAGFIMIMELLYNARSVGAANSNFSSGTYTQDIMNLTLLGTVLDDGGFPRLMYLSMLYPKKNREITQIRVSCKIGVVPAPVSVMPLKGILSARL